MDGLGKWSLQRDIEDWLMEASPSPEKTRTTGFHSSSTEQAVNPQELVEEANFCARTGWLTPSDRALGLKVIVLVLELLNLTSLSSAIHSVFHYLSYLAHCGLLCLWILGLIKTPCFCFFSAWCQRIGSFRSKLHYHSSRLQKQTNTVIFGCSCPKVNILKHHWAVHSKWVNCMAVNGISTSW